MDHELLFSSILVTFFRGDIRFSAALGEDFILKAALGGGHFLALAIFREEFFPGFEVSGSSHFFTALEHLTECFHGGLEFGFFEFRLAAFDGCHESLEESFGIEVVSTHAELAELLGESTTGAEAESVGRI